MQRGRGTLSVAKNNSPFFQTTQGDIGYNTTKETAPDSLGPWKCPLTEEDFAATKGNNRMDSTASELQAAAFDKGNFNFLYTRESDTIGSKVKKPNDDNGKIIRVQPKSKAEFLRDCYRSTEALAAKEKMVMSMGKSLELDATGAMVVPKQSAEEILKSYKHKSKEEDARYTTANNEIGKRTPTVATFVSERHGIPQDFSRSFNNIKPQNTSLNTGITRSTIHPRLDMPFA